MASMRYDGPDVKDPGIHVGTLSLWDPTSHQTSQPVEVYSNEELFIGRDSKRCQIHLTDPFVSNKHVKIYTIIFDQDSLQDIPPLVYAEDLSLNRTFWNDHRMGKGKGSFLLSDGDILTVSAGIHFQFKSAHPNKENRFTALQELEMKTFQKRYVITQRVLGSGAYGRVHMAFNVTTGRQFACKVVDLQATRADFQVRDRIHGDSDDEQKSKFFTANEPLKNTAKADKASLIEGPILDKLAMQQRESLLLAELSHPNIIAVEQIIRSNNTMYMFTELVTCGDLFSFIRNNGGPLDEKPAALIIRQILLALEHLHDRNIVHRDVKPDNILMTSHELGGRVLLADFGCARLVNRSIQRMSSLVGTREYCAPELHRPSSKGYTKAVDMWSLGCVAAVLLVGNTPFDDPCNSLSSDLMNLEMDMDALGITSRAKGFVSQLLVEDETQRMDVKQALRHAWFTNRRQAKWFKEMYNTAIHGWKPRDINQPVIVELTDLETEQTNKRLPSESASTWSLKEGARLADVDHISESSWENHPPGATKPLISPAISHSAPARKSSGRSPLGPVDQNSAKRLKGRKESVCHPDTDTDVKFISQVKREQIDRPKLERPVLYVSPRESPEVQRDGGKTQPVPKAQKPAAKAKSTVNKDTGMRNFFISPPVPRIPPTEKAKPQKLSKAESDESDQVYEEVRNPVTGKRKRLIYGRDMESLSQML